MDTQSLVKPAILEKNGFTVLRASYTGPEPNMFMNAVGNRHIEPTTTNGMTPIMPSLMDCRWRCFSIFEAMGMSHFSRNF